MSALVVRVEACRRQHWEGLGVLECVMKKSLLVIVALLGGTVSAQAQIYTSSTAQGAVIGGVAGAIIGNNSGGRHAPEGALIGALAGALIGHAVDNPPVTRTVVVQSPPPSPCTPPPQVVYVQTAYPRQQVVVYRQAPRVVYVQAQPQTVVYVDGWGRPAPCGYDYGRHYGYGHRW